MTDDELRDLIASNAKAIQANSTAIGELRQEIRELRYSISEQQIEIAEQQVEIARSHRDFLEVRDTFSEAIGRLLAVSDQQQRTLDYLLRKEQERQESNP